MNQEQKKHVSHWIAWSVIALLVGATAFLTWNYSSQIASIYDGTILLNGKKSTAKTATPAATATTTTPTATATPTTTTVADWRTYENSTYNFTMKFTDAWEGFKAISQKNTNDPLVYDTVQFVMPTTDKEWNELDPNLDGFATPFVISVYTLANWDKMIEESQGGATPTEITRDDKYVYAWSGWQACPTDLCGKNFDVKGIIATFKLN